MLCSFFGVMGRVQVMSVRRVCVVGRRLVVPVFMMFRGFPVVVGRMLMVLGGLRVMMRSVLRHEACPFP